VLEAPPAPADDVDVPGAWHALGVITRQSAVVDGRSLHSELTRRIREAGGAGVTTILGECGFSSDEPPYGDRLGRLTSHLPSWTTYIDRAPKVAEVWPIVDTSPPSTASSPGSSCPVSRAGRRHGTWRPPSRWSPAASGAPGEGRSVTLRPHPERHAGPRRRRRAMCTVT
jgi:PII-like signaling protein